MEVVGLTLFFILGGILGSFLNALVYRYKTGLTLGGRSMCFSCTTTLRWYDLVPVASFIALRGKCRYCKSSVSAQYPVVELSLALLFALTFLTTADVVSLSLFLAATFLLFAIVVYDLRHTIIPNAFVYPFIVLGVIHSLFTGGSDGFVFPTTTFIAATGAFLFLALIWFFSRGRAMGFGDAKLVFGMVLFLGASAGITAVVVGFWTGALFGLSGLLFGSFIKRKIRIFGYTLTLKSEIPFAPFLIFGFFLTYYLNLNLFFMLF